MWRNKKEPAATLEWWRLLRSQSRQGGFTVYSPEVGDADAGDTGGLQDLKKGCSGGFVVLAVWAGGGLEAAPDVLHQVYQKKVNVWKKEEVLEVTFMVLWNQSHWVPFGYISDSSVGALRG